MRTRRGWFLLAIVGVAALVGGALVFRQYDSDMRAAHERLQSGSQVVHTSCGAIEYAIAGHGPPLLMVHGSGGGFDQGLEFAAPLVRAGFTVIAPSRFGYLRTPLPSNPSPQAQGDAHACLLDALGFDSVATLGGSAGAPSVLQLCLHYPGRCSAMILIVPAIFVPQPGKPPIKPSPFAELTIRTVLRSDFLLWMSSRMAPDTVIASVLATPASDLARAAPDEQRRVLAVLQHIQPISHRSQGLWTDSTVTTAPAQLDFERIGTPTLIITTENDGYGTIAGARIAARRIPGAHLISYPDGGHLWVGHQSEVWSAVVQFLGERASERYP